MIDLQQSSPPGWCPVCRMEIYEEGQNLCSACREQEEREESAEDD